MNVHFSSASDDWATPADFFKAADDEFGPLLLDVCASPLNAKCVRFFTREDNGLAQVWGGRCWMNPPYGREIGKWVKRAREAAESGEAERVVCLLPARTDTAWWHDHISRAAVVRFLRGRLKFGGCKNSAPFPSVLVVFKRGGAA